MDLLFLVLILTEGNMRRIGNGYEGLKRFLVLMNHSPPVTEKNYRKISHAFN